MSNLTVAGTKDHPITIGPIAELENARAVWRGQGTIERPANTRSN